MSTQTTILGITKPDLADAADITVINSNMDIIESAIVGVKTATITTTWVGTSAPYTQEVSISGVKSTDRPLISPVYDANNATAILQKTAWGCISKIETGADKITITCFEEKPVTAIPIQLKGV